MSNEIENTKELTGALTDLVTMLSGIANSAKDFTAENLPDVVSQLITWVIVKNCILIAIYSLIVGVLLYFAFKMRGWSKKDGYNEWMVGVIVLPVFAALLSIPLICNLMSLIKINIATKLWLAEYATNLIR